MEENENVEVNETVVNDVASNNGEGMKNKKNLIIGIVIAVVVLVILYNVFFNTKGKAKGVVKDFIKATSSFNAKKMINCVDPYGAVVFNKLDKDEYEDFWAEYKEYLKSDDYKEYKEEYEEDKKETISDMQESFDELKENLKDEDIKFSMKVKDIKSVKKVGKNLYKVKAKIQVKADDEDKTSTMEFYVMKKGMSCYIVGGDYENLLGTITLLGLGM